MNPLLDSKAARFDQLPWRICVGLMPEANALLLCVDRRAHIFTTPPQSQLPDFVQHFDRSCAIDLAHEMNPSSTQRQAPFRDQLTQVSSQQPQRCAASHLSGCLAIECGRVVMVHVPAPEDRGLGFDLGNRGELVPRPEAADPHRVKAFDLKVALGFVIGREQRLDPTEQTGTHDLTEDVPMGVSATKGAFVVELVQAGQPQLCPAVQQMNTTCATGLVQVLRQADGMREVVDGMKVLYLLSAAQMLGDDVGGQNGIDVLGYGPGIVGGTACSTKRMGQLVFGQNALNSSFAGQGSELQLLETSPNRAWANQAIARRGGRRCLEELSNREHRSDDMRGHLLGQVMRRTRAVGKVGVGVLAIVSPPFVEPRGGAVQVATNVAAALALQVPTNGFAA